MTSRGKTVLPAPPTRMSRLHSGVRRRPLGTSFCPLQSLGTQPLPALVTEARPSANC